MTQILASNNAQATVSGGISSVATSVTFSPAGSGSLFPNPGPNQVYALTHINSTTNAPGEIVYVTAMIGDTATIVRGRESTSAEAWNSGDTVANQLTAGTLNYLAQIQNVQQNAYNYAVDTGVANAYVVTLNPVPVLTKGFYLILSAANTNTTTTPTITVNGTTVNITLPGGAALSAGQIPANTPLVLIYNTTGPRFELQNVSSQTVVNSTSDPTFADSSNNAASTNWVKGLNGSTLYGLNQSPYDMTSTYTSYGSSAAAGSTYYNTTGKPINVQLAFFGQNSGGGAALIYVNGSPFAYGSTAVGSVEVSVASATIPTGGNFAFSWTSTGTYGIYVVKVLK